VNWIELAQVRARLQIFMLTVLELWVILGLAAVQDVCCLQMV